MKLVIQGKNIEITDSIRNYVHQKIEKAVSHYQHLTMEVDVHLSVARNPRIALQQQVAEVTIYANGAVIRAEEQSEDLYASIDMVADKISRRLRKYKEKRQSKRDHTSVKAVPPEVLEESAGLTPDALQELITKGEPVLPTDVVRMKYFPMPPMNVEEALEQLQLVGHDFFMFHNRDTEEINVIYKRNHGGFGVIQPRLANQTNGHRNGNAHHANGNGNGHANGHSSYQNGNLTQLNVPAAQVPDRG